MPSWAAAWRSLRIPQLLRAIGSRFGRLHALGIEWLKESRRSPVRAAQEAMRNKRRAERRARLLLLSLLTAEQREEFLTQGYFHVVGGATRDRYRIRSDSTVNIDVFGHGGIITHSLCARPNGDIPICDVMAGQLLHLQDQCTETRFLARANRHYTLPVFARLDG